MGLPYLSFGIQAEKNACDSRKLCTKFLNHLGSTFIRPQSLRMYHCTAGDRKSIVAPGSLEEGKLENHYFDSDLFSYESQIVGKSYSIISNPERESWFSGAKADLESHLLDLRRSYPSGEVTLFSLSIFGEVFVRPSLQDEWCWLFRDRHPISQEWNPILDLSFHSNSFGTFISSHTYSSIWSEFTNEYDHANERWIQKGDLELAKENIALLVKFFKGVEDRLDQVKWTSYVESEIPRGGELLQQQLSAAIDNA